ncbi:hypothetical protein Tco_1514665 [Tanacetum coccineum]
MALSTAEAEYVSLSACCAQVIWMWTQLTDYGYHFHKIIIYCNSKSSIAISCNPVQHSRTKHIVVRYYFIKEHVEKGTIELYFVKTDYQLADLFTKALRVDRFNYLVCRLGMRSLSPHELERLAKSQIEDPKEDDLKSPNILMKTLPSEQLLSFNKHNDAKSLFVAIEAKDLVGKRWNVSIVISWDQRGCSRVQKSGVKRIGIEIAVLKRDASFNELDNNNGLKKQVERLKKEKEDNQIDNFENASKKFGSIDGKQISNNNKKGLGYNVVPPPLTGLFVPLSIDLSNSGLEKFKQSEFEGYGVKVNKGSENVSKEVKKTSDAPIIEDWVSDCDEDETVVLESLNVHI